jgi:hypothetical protein
MLTHGRKLLKVGVSCVGGGLWADWQDAKSCQRKTLPQGTQEESPEAKWGKGRQPKGNVECGITMWSDCVHLTGLVHDDAAS